MRVKTDIKPQAFILQLLLILYWDGSGVAFTYFFFYLHCIKDVYHRLYEQMEDTAESQK